jgi:hypothetical protein
MACSVVWCKSCLLWVHLSGLSNCLTCLNVSWQGSPISWRPHDWLGKVYPPPLPPRYTYTVPVQLIHILSTLHLLNRLQLETFSLRIFHELATGGPWFIQSKITVRSQIDLIADVLKISEGKFYHGICDLQWSRRFRQPIVQRRKPINEHLRHRCFYNRLLSTRIWHRVVAHSTGWNFSTFKAQIFWLILKSLYKN